MAKLPNVDRALIEPRKITGYLLSPTHPKGAPKCAFFGGFGFKVADWEKLRDALLAHAVANEVDWVYATDYGMMIEVVGPLAAPDGRAPKVLVVWTIRTGEDFPRLVTAVPA